MRRASCALLCLAVLGCGGGASSNEPSTSTLTAVYLLEQVNRSALPYAYVQGSSTMTTFSGRYDFQGAEVVYRDSVTYYAPSLGDQNFSKTCRFTLDVSATRILLYPKVAGCGAYTELTRDGATLTRTADHQEYRYRQQ